MSSSHLMTQTATENFNNFIHTPPANSSTGASPVNVNSLYIMTRRKLIFGTCKGCGKPNDRFNECNSCADWINQQMAYLKQMENLIEIRRLRICEQKLMCKFGDDKEDPKKM
ncbi:3517_t:CDS:1 [Acaulospora colombiana]|uniref:3517_t:CDS:1 n=1 Tax=Acaulospora colombiana TaxID=27376 RepID=A0ACA9K1C3_9GLOM|nr:3517_t:CDS:1 [Acaulospora colombiana]